MHPHVNISIRCSCNGRSETKRQTQEFKVRPVRKIKLGKELAHTGVYVVQTEGHHISLRAPGRTEPGPGSLVSWSLKSGRYRLLAAETVRPVCNSCMAVSTGLYALTQIPDPVQCIALSHSCM